MQSRETGGPNRGLKRKNAAEDVMPCNSTKRLPPTSKDGDTRKEMLKRHSKPKPVDNTSASSSSKTNISGAPQYAGPSSCSLAEKIIASSTPPPSLEHCGNLSLCEGTGDKTAGPSALRKLGDVLHSKVQHVIMHNAVIKAARNLFKRSREPRFTCRTPDVQKRTTSSALQDKTHVYSVGSLGSDAQRPARGKEAAQEPHGSRKQRRRFHAKAQAGKKSMVGETKPCEKQCSISTAFNASEAVKEITTSTSARHASQQHVLKVQSMPSPSPVVVMRRPTCDTGERWKKQDPMLQFQNCTQAFQLQNAAIQPGEQAQNEDEEMEDLSETITQSISGQQPLVDYKGIYLITDTNVFLQHLDLIKKIVNADTGSATYIVCVPWIVVQELDRIRNRRTDKKDLSAMAFKAILYINKMLETKNPKLRGQTIAEARGKEGMMPHDNFSTDDDHLLYCCLSLKHQGSRVILMTNDTNLRNKALIHDIESYKAHVVEKNLRNILAKAPIETPTEECAGMRPLPAIVQQGNEAVWQEVTATLQRCLSLVLETELRSALGNNWIAEVAVKPPWTAHNALECALKHWTDCHLLPSSAFNCTIQPSIKRLEKILKETKQGIATSWVPTEKLEELFLHTVKVCSHLQLHYFQLAEEVAILKHLEASWLQHTNSQLAVISEGDTMSVPHSHQNAVATLRALLRTGQGDAAHAPLRQPVSQPDEQPPARPPSPPSLPPALPSVQRDEDAVHCIQLLQSSWSLINDYCGTVCKQVSICYAFPYQENPSFVSNLACLQAVYKYVYQTREHMERMLKRPTQDALRDVASLFLETLQRLVHLLQRKMGVPEARFEASASQVTQFFADGNRRELIDNGYKQIVTFQDALGYCLLDATKLESTNVRRTPPPSSSRANLRN